MNRVVLVASTVHEVGCEGAQSGAPSQRWEINLRKDNRFSQLRRGALPIPPDHNPSMDHRWHLLLRKGLIEDLYFGAFLNDDELGIARHQANF